MFISVIVPIYHGNKYIPKLIYMMERNRMYLKGMADIELILVNDYPQENCLVPDNENFRIKYYINKKNSGIHYSRVRGLIEASGEYVLFLDQDDAIADNYLYTQYISINDADMIVSNGITVIKGGYCRQLYRYKIMQISVKWMWFYALFDCRIISPGQCLIKKDSIPKIWIEKKIKNNGADDMFLWLLFLNDKKKICINRKIIYKHVYTNENASLNIEQMHASVREFLTIAECYECINKYIVRYIRKRLDYEEGKKYSSVLKSLSILRKFIENLNQK